MTAKDIDCSYCGAKAGGPCVRYDGYTREPHVIREQEASFRAWQNAAESLPAALEQKCEQCGEPLGSGHHVDGLCYAGGEVNKWLPVAEPVAPVEAKPFYENSECADCDGKLYGKKAFWVPTTGKTPGKKLICETCANAAESLLPEPAQEMKVDGAQIWVGSREWVRREEEKKMQVALQKMREIKPVEPLSVEAKEKERCPSCNHKAHFALRCGALIATGSDEEYAEEVRCECLNWVAEPKPTPSAPESDGYIVLMCDEHGVTDCAVCGEEDEPDKFKREAFVWSQNLIDKQQEPVKWREIAIGVKADLMRHLHRRAEEIMKPQPDSSSVSTEQTFEEWYGNSYPVYQECATRNVTRYGIDPVEARQHKEAASNAWAAAKGQR